LHSHFESSATEDFVSRQTPCILMGSETCGLYAPLQNRRQWDTPNSDVLRWGQHKNLIKKRKAQQEYGGHQHPNPHAMSLETQADRNQQHHG
jgi:hypothetical protein